MKFILIGLIFILFASCLPEQAQVRTLDQGEQESTSDTTDTNTTTELDSNFNFNLKWNNAGLTSDILTINVDNSKNIYLMGDKLHDYLEDDTAFARSYCMEMRFEKAADTIPKILRVRAIPTLSTNFQKGVTTRFFRIALNSSVGNDTCNLSSIETVNNQDTTISAGDTNYDGIVDANDNSYVYHSSSVCTECLNFLVSNKINFYYVDEGATALTTDDTLNRVEPELDYSNLIMRIDMNSSSDSGQSSCSDNSCQAEGFDCCIEGQCVNEKNIKVSGVSADPNGFLSAEAEKYLDTNWYKKYPQFYYICLEKVPTDSDGADTSDDPTDPVSDANTRLEELISDYECIEELKTNSEADPFHRNPINSSATYSKCNTTDSTNTMYYEEVMKRLYNNCGCIEKTNLTDMVNNCPSYTYTPVYQTDSNGNQTTTITSISCVTPEAEKTPLPFQDLEVYVNSRSAPHRFFDTTNTEIDPEESLPSGATGTQEGDRFEYLDDYYIFPNNGQFNMNSILGQFDVDLSYAHPAKVIDIEFDKQYIISTLEGYLSSCPTCAKDSWFGNFSFAPTANRGVGLQAVGFTTRRDTYGSNITLGNYEDTIFGRACWIPPTMIPYGHTENSDSQQQRLDRLQTQSALYVNGYQRDWYGFNRGALIGSFDGVTWFAVGKGRIVKSTSNKLFLAINAPFADLANTTNHKVAVQEYDFTATAANYDYVNGLEINDSGQNEAGSCQSYHECETDSHCISKLGWEYVCADVTYMQTKWPSFDAIGAVEQANTSRSGSIIDFLQQATLPPDSTTKRCVYRGAGAPCRTDYENISDEGLRKNLTCAPNFYCANVASSNAFNTEVARYGKPLDELLESPNHLYGQDANILGRPKHYLNTGNLTSLNSDIQSTISENITLSDSSATGNIGLCRPGKLLPSYQSLTATRDWRASDQHKEADNKYRTDYISQIAGCNSTLYTNLRYSSCPILDEDGNHIYTQDNFVNNSFTPEDTTTALNQEQTVLYYSAAQNSCGLESLSSSVTLTTATEADDLKEFSAFKYIEGLTLASSTAIIEESVARDACFRKPGAVCHTDLDCSPNRLMAETINLAPSDYYGNDAEKKYFEEYLVCGQAEAEPREGDYNYNTYSIHNNRCCRPIGEDLTMYTEDSPNVTESQGLRTDVFGSYYPNEPTRYSRYAVASTSVDSDLLSDSIVRPSANTEDADFNKILDNSVNITDSYQWETIHNTAARTCCGGTWMRKFADGTNDWSKNRLNLNVENFKCLNYNTPLMLSEDPTSYGVTRSQIDNDLNNYCPDPTQESAGCAEVATLPLENLNSVSVKPRLDTTSTLMVIDTDEEIMESQWASNLWAYHTLLAQNGSVDPSQDPLVLDWSDSDILKASRRFIRTKLPSFVTFDPANIDTELTVEMEDPTAPGSGATTACRRITAPNNGSYTCGDGNDETFGGLCDDIGADSTPLNSNTPFEGVTCLPDTCCYLYHEDSRTIAIAYNNTISNDAATYYGDTDHVYSARISWTAAGTLKWESDKAGSIPTTTADLVHRRSSTPGNSMYYLERLSKLEYLGIPQMVYEPVYCNDNYQKLVPGIFEEVSFGQQLQTVLDFLNHTKTFYDTNAGAPWNTDSAAAPLNIDSAGLNQNLVATQELIAHPAIFSDNEFKCCLELGSTTMNPSMCCSGVGKTADAPADEKNNSEKEWYTCAIPDGTDLNVYFNKFVSGEGISDTYSDTTLEKEDFNPRTGEPEISESVYKKLVSLGNTFCASGQVRRGSAFGNFVPAPKGPLRDFYSKNSEVQYTFVDNIFDFGNILNQNVGYTYFSSGLRWNHHVYCDVTDE